MFQYTKMRTGLVFLLIIMTIIIFVFFATQQQSHHMEVVISRTSIDTMVFNNSGYIDYQNCDVEINRDFRYDSKIELPAGAIINISLNDFYPEFPLSDEITLITLICDGITNSWSSRIQISG